MLVNTLWFRTGYWDLTNDTLYERWILNALNQWLNPVAKVEQNSLFPQNTRNWCVWRDSLSRQSRRHPADWWPCVLHHTITWPAIAYQPTILYSTVQLPTIPCTDPSYSLIQINTIPNDELADNRGHLHIIPCNESSYSVLQSPTILSDDSACSPSEPTDLSMDDLGYSTVQLLN